MKIKHVWNHHLVFVELQEKISNPCLDQKASRMHVFMSKKCKQIQYTWVDRQVKRWVFCAFFWHHFIDPKDNQEISTGHFESDLDFQSSNIKGFNLKPQAPRHTGVLITLHTTCMLQFDDICQCTTSKTSSAPRVKTGKTKQMCHFKVHKIHKLYKLCVHPLTKPASIYPLMATGLSSTYWRLIGNPWESEPFDATWHNCKYYAIMSGALLL